MDILKMLFEVDTRDLDKAKGKVEDVGKASEKAQSKATRLKDALKEVGGTNPLIGEVAGRVDDLKSQLASASAVARSFPPLLLAAAGAAGVLAAVRFAGPLDDLTKLADKFGLSATQAAVMAQNMDPGGIQTYFNAIDRVANSLNKADDESKQAQEALRTLRVAANETADPVKILTDLTERYGEKLREGNLTNEETAALQSVLGKSYRETMLQVEEAAYAQERLNYWTEAGIGISADGAAASNEFADANDYLSDMMKVMGSILVGEVVPAFSNLIRAFVDSYKNGGLVKAAFDGIRVAAQIVMVPIRMLFNAFIQLDAAITSVGKGLGAVFAAIATRSLDPIKAMKEEVAKIWETANSRTTGIWSWDSGQVQPGAEMPSGGGSGGGGGGGKGKPKTAPKAKESVFADGDPVANLLAKKFDEWRERSARKMDQEEEAELKRLEDLKKRYIDMIDPLDKYKRMLDEIRALREAGMISAEQQLDMELDVQIQMQNALDGTKEKLNEISEVGKLVFENVSRAFSDMVMNSKVNFKEMASTFIKSLLDMYIQAKIMIPLFTMLKSLTGWSWISIPGVASANGNVFGPSGLLKSAKGNVFDGPTLHGYSGGVGMLGEAGPEAIMPLKRGADGKLGVVAQGASGGTVNQYSISVHVQGGKDAQETGTIVSKEIERMIRGIAKQEIASDRRTQAYAV